jgi:glycosyltransferase involved in cell wall biosynthesis
LELQADRIFANDRVAPSVIFSIWYWGGQVKTVLSVIGIEPIRIGGQEAFARELSRQLEQLGWQSVLCFERRPVGAVREYLKLPNVRFEVIESLAQLRWAANWDLFWLLRKYHPTILHLHFTNPLSLYPWIAKVCSVPRIFFTDHGSRPISYTPRRAAFWKRIAARTITWPLAGLVNVSSYGASCVTTQGFFRPDRVQVIYNAVDLTCVRPDPVRGILFRRKYGIPEDRDLVTQVSWIVEEKGIADLLEAARLILSKRANTHFVFVGEGSLRGKYTQLASDLGIAKHVTWTGLVEDPLGEGVYEAAHIVCQPSRWEEMFAYTILEAMAFSRPVVATRLGGNPEAVVDQLSGFLVPREDPAQLAEKILALLSDPDLRKRMGREGRRIVEEKFNVRITASRLLRVYGIQQEVVE